MRLIYAITKPSFADTLELDRAAVNLPAFLNKIREDLESAGTWKSDRLRLVPAPKSQPWKIIEPSGAWVPIKKGPLAAPMRPLAHVSLRDQVVATAIMMCLADRVDTAQGDTRVPASDANGRRLVISYGNRLFCDAVGETLHHRWGSAKLYRSYSEDYQEFINRPEQVAEALTQDPAAPHVYVVHSDLRQFYDRVRPAALELALRALQQSVHEEAFFRFASRVFDWEWMKQDCKDVSSYATTAGIKDFTRVALPQGLVCAGFFANAAMLAFDEMLRGQVGRSIGDSLTLRHACR